MKTTKIQILPLFAGLVFALGLALGGMTRADIVIGFLDVTGAWDPRLAFVMAGAVLFNFVAFRLILKRPNPFWRSDFQVPANKKVDLRLVLGAAIFGIGWGLAGICPGPSLVTVTGLAEPALIFVLGMLGGVWAFRLWDQSTKRA